MLALCVVCGKTGIRTLGTVARTTVFETVPIDHSGIFPMGRGEKVKTSSHVQWRKFTNKLCFGNGFVSKKDAIFGG